MKRNPHPARRSRIATLGISTSAFVSIVTGLVWNTHQAELAANVVNTNAALVEQVAPVPGSATQVAPTSGATTPAATISPTAPAAPAKQNAATPANPTTNSSAPATSPVAPTTPDAAPVPAAPVVAPAPAPAPVVYTCMSPGGSTEGPSGSGGCPNARYGYVLTQI